MSNAVLMQRGDVVHLLIPSLVRNTQPNHDLFLLASLLASCYTVVSVYSTAMIRRVIWDSERVAAVVWAEDGYDVPIVLCNLDMP